MIKILITGAQGFVGKNLTELFLQENYCVLSPSIEQLNLLDFESVNSFFNENKIDVIIHCATTLRNGTAYPVDVCEKNIRMFFNLLKAKSENTKLINLGSGSEYSRQYWHEKMKEKFFGTHIPDDGHCLSKYIISKYIEDANLTNVTTLRIFGIFGKYEDHRFKFISNAVAKNIKKLPIVINQNVCFDYLDVVDFYKVVKFFCHNRLIHHSYNVTPVKSIDLITIAKIINELSEYTSEIIVLNEGLGVNYSGDNSRLLSQMVDFEFLDYKKSIGELFRYYSENSEQIDEEALIKDEFLSYAKNLKKSYFSKGGSLAN